MPRGSDEMERMLSISVLALGPVVPADGGLFLSVGDGTIACCAQIYVTALGKDETIADAGSLLVTTMARHVDNGTVFDELAERPIVIPPPQKGPLLIEPVRATITLKGRRAGKVFALDHDGRKQSDAMETPVETTRDGISFTVNGAKSKTVYYLVEFEQ